MKKFIMKKFEYIAIMSDIYTQFFSIYIDASYLILFQFSLNLIVSKIFDIPFNDTSTIIVSVVITLFCILHKKTNAAVKRMTKTFEY